MIKVLYTPLIIGRYVYDLANAPLQIPYAALNLSSFFFSYASTYNQSDFEKVFATSSYTIPFFEILSIVWSSSLLVRTLCDRISPVLEGQARTKTIQLGLVVMGGGVFFLVIKSLRNLYSNYEQWSEKRRDQAVVDQQIKLALQNNFNPSNVDSSLPEPPNISAIKALEIKYNYIEFLYPYLKITRLSLHLALGIFSSSHWIYLGYAALSAVELLHIPKRFYAFNLRQLHYSKVTLQPTAGNAVTDQPYWVLLDGFYRLLPDQNSMLRLCQVSDHQFSFNSLMAQANNNMRGLSFKTYIPPSPGRIGELQLDASTTFKYCPSCGPQKLDSLKAWVWDQNKWISCQLVIQQPVPPTPVPLNPPLTGEVRPELPSETVVTATSTGEVRPELPSGTVVTVEEDVRRLSTTQIDE